jgi:hypothetical protein
MLISTLAENKQPFNVIRSLDPRLSLLAEIDLSLFSTFKKYVYVFFFKKCNF